MIPFLVNMGCARQHWVMHAAMPSLVGDAVADGGSEGAICTSGNSTIDIVGVVSYRDVSDSKPYVWSCTVSLNSLLGESIIVLIVCSVVVAVQGCHGVWQYNFCVIGLGNFACL